MTKKLINKIGLIIVIQIALLPSCHNNVIQNTLIQKTINNNQNTIITGEVYFHEKFNIKATQEDISNQSTISVLYPSNYLDISLANSTIAVGLTDSTGKFKIIPDTSFTPKIGDIFILEARKRLGGDGKDILSLKTFIKWTGNSWTSITGNTIYINSKTTALSLISGYEPTLLSPEQTIEKIMYNNSIANIQDINEEITSQKIVDLESLVNSALTSNQDPIQALIYQNNNLSYSSISVPITRGNHYLGTLGEGKIYQPTAIDIRDGNIYISSDDKGDGLFNNAEGLVISLDLDGNIIKTISGGVLDTLPRELNGVASDGSRVWTINKIPYGQSQNNTYSFSTLGAGRLNSKLGLTGSVGTNFQDLAIDSSSNYLYIASSGTESIIKVKYNSEIIDTSTQQLYFSGPTKLNPVGICVDNLGNLFVSNIGTPYTIIKFDKEGKKLLEFNTIGLNELGPIISTIGDVAFDPRNGGTIYILAEINGTWQILRYDNSGNYIRSFGSGKFIKPRSIAVNSDGTIYVTDYEKKVILKFSESK